MDTEGNIIMNYNLEKMFGLKDQVIVVTGAGGGIGQEVVIALAELGAKTVGIDLVDEGLTQTRLKLEKSGLSGLFHRVDITDEAAVEAVAVDVVKHYGKIDGLVNFAGITKLENLFDFDMADFQRILNVNINGSVICCKVFGKRMVENKYGRIINISSVRGLQGKAKYSAYAASKGAINTFTKSLAVEWALDNVNVNAIAPIFTLTDLNRKSLEDKAHHDWVISRLPKGRMCEKSELVGPVVFLLSPGSQFITGEILYVDGGWTAG